MPEAECETSAQGGTGKAGKLYGVSIHSIIEFRELIRERKNKMSSTSRYWPVKSAEINGQCQTEFGSTSEGEERRSYRLYLETTISSDWQISVYEMLLTTRLELKPVKQLLGFFIPVSMLISNLPNKSKNRESKRRSCCPVSQQRRSGRSLFPDSEDN